MDTIAHNIANADSPGYQKQGKEKVREKEKDKGKQDGPKKKN
jgi:flagellar basal body rod protein FlgB